DRRPVEDAPHLGHLLRPLADQEYKDLALGMVVQKTEGDLLQQDRLAGARRGDDQAALALADGRHQVEDAEADVLRPRRQVESLAGVQRGEVLEGERAARLPGTIRLLACGDSPWGLGLVVVPRVGTACRAHRVCHCWSR